MRRVLAAAFALCIAVPAFAQSGLLPANQVWAGPTSGGQGFARARALVGADVPAPGASSLGGVQSLTCSSSNWFRTLSTGGVFGCSQPAITDISGLGTGVATALGITPGSAGSVVVNGGAGGTPSSLVATNATGTAAGLTAGHVTTNANLTGDVTSVGNATTYTNVVPAAKGGAGAVTGALKANGSGTVTQAVCADLSGVAASCATDATNAANISSGTLPAARLPSGMLTNSLAAPVALSNVGLFFDGPVVAQGAVGTWFVSGTVTLIDVAGAATFFCKLWDGVSTPIASAPGRTTAINISTSVSLSGGMTSPAGNLRISCNDPTSISGAIQSNATGVSKDSTITAYRIN